MPPAPPHDANHTRTRRGACGTIAFAAAALAACGQKGPLILPPPLPAAAASSPATTAPVPLPPRPNR